MYPPKRVGVDSIGNCTEVCPADLIKALHLEHAATNQDDILRAEWFWSRRPKVLCANLIALFCYIVILVSLAYFVPQSALFLVVWMVVGASGVFVDCCRLDRWEKEYASSIKRLILPLLKHS
jgi:hypothetical protein